MTTKYPRVIEVGGKVTGIELVENVVISWTCVDGVWKVQIGSVEGGIELHGPGVSVEPVVH